MQCPDKLRVITLGDGGPGVADAPHAVTLQYSPVGQRATADDPRRAQHHLARDPQPTPPIVGLGRMPSSGGGGQRRRASGRRDRRARPKAAGSRRSGSSGPRASGRAACRLSRRERACDRGKQTGACSWIAQRQRSVFVLEQHVPSRGVTIYPQAPHNTGAQGRLASGAWCRFQWFSWLQPLGTDLGSSLIRPRGSFQISGVPS